MYNGMILANSLQLIALSLWIHFVSLVCSFEARWHREDAVLSSAVQALVSHFTQSETLISDIAAVTFVIV